MVLFILQILENFLFPSASTLLTSTIFNSAPYIVSVATTSVAITDLDLFNKTIFTAIDKIRRNGQIAEINAVFKEIIKDDHNNDINKDVLQQKINRRKDSQQN